MKRVSGAQAPDGQTGTTAWLPFSGACLGSRLSNLYIVGTKKSVANVAKSSPPLAVAWDQHLIAEPEALSFISDIVA
jgi:hypothetical protein